MPKKPGDDKALRQKWLQTVMDLRVLGIPKSKIVKTLSSQENISNRTVWRYLQMADQAFSDIGSETNAVEKGLIISQIDSCVSKLLSQKEPDLSLVNQFINSKIRLLSLNAQKGEKHNAQPTVPEATLASELENALQQLKPFETSSEPESESSTS